MDSISQIVLGAAVGEVVLGKKIGNKAMLIGGIAGTIPDLDVIASPFISELAALSFHRGITHSIFFDIVGGLFFGWLTHKLFNLNNKEKPSVQVSMKEWSWFFFWCFFTHAILDCFTMYGTQLSAPFSDYRVAFATVAVADFFYTIPFIICLFLASRFNKNDQRRRKWNWIGIGWSCFYLLLTVFNKQYVTNVYKAQLAEQNIKYERLLVGPTILSNFLWNATVELKIESQKDKKFSLGQYSVFDTSDIQFVPVDQKDHLLDSDIKRSDKTIQTLNWFTNGYYVVMTRKDGRLQLNDLRFGTFSGKVSDENDFIFRFPIEKNNLGYELLKVGKGPEEGNRKDMVGEIWNRIKGI